MDFKIKSEDKILIIALHPDDAAIACGGFIAKYHAQIDILCVNIDGLIFEGRTFAAQQAADTDYSAFQKIAEKSQINNIFIDFPTAQNEGCIKTIDERIESYLEQISLNDYDIILAPQKDESHPEYRFVGNVILKALLEKQEYKKSLKILRYELFNPIKDANYYEDITDVINEKQELLMSYKAGEGQSFVQNILNLNKFRTFTSYLSETAKYVEAYYLDDTEAFMDVPDIINENTDKDYENEFLKSLFEGQDVQSKIKKAEQEFADKKIILYGAGDYTRYIFKNFDLSGLNIIGISDERFSEERTHEFYDMRCLKPGDLKTADFDLILVSEQDFVKGYNDISRVLKGSKNEAAEIRSLVKTEYSDFAGNGAEHKVCARPFHIMSVTPGGFCITCCPAYIKNHTIGRLSSEKFNEIWNGAKAKNLRKALLSEDYSFCDLNTCIQMELIDREEISKYFNDNGVVKMPDTIYMGWDYDCNVACITCRNQLIKNNEATLQGLQTIEQGVLDACRNAKLFYTSGNGDPFGSSYASDLIKKVAAVNPDIKFFIHTNGILCTEKRCEELNIKDRISNVIFSIHAAKKETYDKIVRYGNFDKVMQNIEWISEQKRKGNISSFILAFVVHKLNYKDMPDFVRIAEKYDALASFRYYRQWSNNTEYKYSDMAVFEKTHPEYTQLVSVLQDKIFDSSHCVLDPSLRTIREKGI